MIGVLEPAPSAFMAILFVIGASFSLIECASCHRYLEPNGFSAPSSFYVHHWWRDSGMDVSSLTHSSAGLICFRICLITSVIVWPMIVNVFLLLFTNVELSFSRCCSWLNGTVQDTYPSSWQPKSTFRFHGPLPVSHSSYAQKHACLYNIRACNERNSSFNTKGHTRYECVDTASRHRLYEWSIPNNIFLSIVSILRDHTTACDTTSHHMPWQQTIALHQMSWRDMTSQWHDTTCHNSNHATIPHVTSLSHSAIRPYDIITHHFTAHDITTTTQPKPNSTS